jgi:hypothetical protein
MQFSGMWRCVGLVRTKTHTASCPEDCHSSQSPEWKPKILYKAFILYYRKLLSLECQNAKGNQKCSTYKIFYTTVIIFNSFMPGILNKNYILSAHYNNKKSHLQKLFKFQHNKNNNGYKLYLTQLCLRKNNAMVPTSGLQYTSKPEVHWQSFKMSANFYQTIHLYYAIMEA